MSRRAAGRPSVLTAAAPLPKAPPPLPLPGARPRPAGRPPARQVHYCPGPWPAPCRPAAVFYSWMRFVRSETRRHLFLDCMTHSELRVYRCTAEQGEILFIQCTLWQQPRATVRAGTTGAGPALGAAAGGPARTPPGLRPSAPPPAIVKSEDGARTRFTPAHPPRCSWLIGAAPHAGPGPGSRGPPSVDSSDVTHAGPRSRTMHVPETNTVPPARPPARARRGADRAAAPRSSRAAGRRLRSGIGQVAPAPAPAGAPLVCPGRRLI